MSARQRYQNAPSNRNASLQSSTLHAAEGETAAARHGKYQEPHGNKGAGQQQQHCQQHRPEGAQDQDRVARSKALRSMSPEEYLLQTGVSAVMENALGLAAGSRPADPLGMFADM